jgi:hypothetical protein
MRTMGDVAAAAPRDQAATIRDEMAARRGSLPPLSQAGVADNVCSNDGRQFALLTGHGDCPDVVHQIVGGFGPVDNEMVERGAGNTARGALLAPWLP